MNRIIKFSAVFLFGAITATAQQDNLTVYREFARLGQRYLTAPLQMKVHFTYKVSPATSVQDSAETDMELHYNNHDFYMLAEGMEQIANDSLIVMVNHEAKMIRVYSNEGLMLRKLQSAMAMFVPDSSLQKLAQMYSANIQDESPGIKRVTLQSRDKISGTDLIKESISVTYDAATYQPLIYHQAKFNLIPVDSTMYNQVKNDSTYTRRLLSTKTNAGNLFFVVKEKATRCRFINISHQQQAPPAREQDRVLRLPNGEYKPANGFDEYMVRREL